MRVSGVRLSGIGAARGAGAEEPGDEPVGTEGAPRGAPVAACGMSVGRPSGGRPAVRGTSAGKPGGGPVAARGIGAGDPADAPGATGDPADGAGGILAAARGATMGPSMVPTEDKGGSGPMGSGAALV